MPLGVRYSGYCMGQEFSPSSTWQSKGESHKIKSQILTQITKEQHIWRSSAFPFFMQLSILILILVILYHWQQLMIQVCLVPFNKKQVLVNLYIQDFSVIFCIQIIQEVTGHSHGSHSKHIFNFPFSQTSFLPFMLITLIVHLSQ